MLIDKTYYQKNRDKSIKQVKEYYQNNKQKIKDYKKLFYQKNKDNRKIQMREYNIKNKEKIKEYNKRPERMASNNAHSSVTQYKRSLRVPSWSDLKVIQKFYMKCPEGMVVDHIIPLLGKTVSGLHVLSNLQYLTPEENNRKNNKYEIKEIAK